MWTIEHFTILQWLYFHFLLVSLCIYTHKNGKLFRLLVRRFFRLLLFLWISIKCELTTIGIGIEPAFHTVWEWIALYFTAVRFKWFQCKQWKYFEAIQIIRWARWEKNIWQKTHSFNKWMKNDGTKQKRARLHSHKHLECFESDFFSQSFDWAKSVHVQCVAIFMQKLICNTRKPIQIETNWARK